MKARLTAVGLLLSLALGPAGAAGLSIQDDRGATVSLPAPPQRLISLSGGLTEILAALGLGDRIVGRIQGDQTVPAAPTVGTHLQPNVEMILALRPDLVVQGGVAKGLPALERLTAQGVAVALFDPRDFAGLFGVISRLGTITNREQQAAALVAAMEAKLAEVARRVAGKPRLSVFFEVRYPNLLAAGQDNLVSDIIAKAGGVNALEHPKKLVPYSLEALLQVNPEVYIIQRGPMNKSPEDIFRRPNFQELRAVKNRRVFLVEEDLFSRPGPRSAEAVARLADLLHGEIRGETAP